MSSSAARIRSLLADGETVNMPGVYDALTARLADQAGFPVMFISGYSVSAARLAAPDFGYITQTEMTQAATAVCSAVDAAVIVDADTGYGNALSARRTAEEFARAGAAGVFLEDQEWPKKCGHFAGKRVVDRDDWLAKLRALVDLREEGVDLYVVARTDARAAVSLDEAIERAKSARDLGVDAIFVEAPRTLDELERVGREVEDTVRVANMIEGGRTPLLTPAELSELGYDLIVTPLSALMAATHAVREAFARLRDEGTLAQHRGRLVDFTEFEGVVGTAEHRELERRYSPD